VVEIGENIRNRPIKPYSNQSGEGSIFRDGQRGLMRKIKGYYIIRTSVANIVSRYFHPLFCVSTSHEGTKVPDTFVRLPTPVVGPDGVLGHEWLGRMIRATNAESTEPTEKNTDSAVTRYCFAFGTYSNKRVPSVGMEPYTVTLIVESMK